MKTSTTPWNRYDTLLGVMLRILLVLLFCLGGAWLFMMFLRHESAPWLGAVAGGVLIALIFRKEEEFRSFCARHKEVLGLCGLFLYVVLLGVAAYSELYDLGWFRWLDF